MLLSPPASPTRINLTFHGIGRPSRRLTSGEDLVWVSAERFMAALDAVRGRPNVRITFDDGNRSDIEIALPALRERGLRATFFVLAGQLDDPAHVSAGDLRTLTRAGMSIGTHGMDHVDWRTVDDAGLRRELHTARHRLEAACGQPVIEAAVPFGRYDRRVLSALRRHGYAHVYTSDGGAARDGAWLQARSSLRSTDGPAQLMRLLAPERSAGALAVGNAKTALKRWR